MNSKHLKNHIHSYFNINYPRGYVIENPCEV